MVLTKKWTEIEAKIYHPYGSRLSQNKGSIFRRRSKNLPQWADRPLLRCTYTPPGIKNQKELGSAGSDPGCAGWTQEIIINSKYPTHRWGYQPPFVLELFSMCLLSIMWTSLPSLKRAIHGRGGGKGSRYSLAFATASVSTPAKTVTILSGLLPWVTANLAAGRVFPAAQPHRVDNHKDRTFCLV